LFERINLDVGSNYNGAQDLEPLENLKYKNYSGYNLPLTMDITK
jgi:hypothetical protein